jgi:Na+/glutamate symporter
MVDLTLLRVDVDVESITADAKAYAPFSKSVGRDGPDGGDGADDSGGATVEVERGGGRRGRVKVGLAAALVGLVFLVVAGVILRRYVTEGDEEEDLETAEVTIE